METWRLLGSPLPLFKKGCGAQGASLAGCEACS